MSIENNQMCCISAKTFFFMFFDPVKQNHWIEVYIVGGNSLIFPLIIGVLDWDQRLTGIL